ncbi:MAG TPA: filamentous hemagglutinin N-terminal domain-containing protein [Oscillatoriaceae cyanobacterium M33_DOE_052]|uniref:Filamentous hemagglutinin N-terminal domain-containing protein n=1 Tax=Planktothricoides sp. SpSt-374 TaxID=2282167 RepID=A0A7C3ZYS3_9CYAN|nr:filamentous hemagglutinin N-terminal domain-containing protein [Oscillatoriaceae cyanobacterium M33_DOE_052]
MTNYIAPPIAALMAILTPASFALAQIIPDASLPVNSIVTQDGNNFQITGGTTAGANLFHSFQEFSLPTGGEVYFNNGAAIANIFSRITGNSISHIDGIIKTNASANLYLLNPNGIIFGANAQLNIGGSFLATTAQSVVFNDGTLFGIPTTDTAPLLTINVPTGLQYGTNAGGVGVEGATLAVPEGKNLGLFGGNVTVEGGILRALGGRLDLAGFAEPILAINLDANSEGVVRSGDIAVTGGARLEGRDITLAAGTISIGDNSLVRSAGGNSGTNAGVAGNISVLAGAGVTISDSTLESVSNSNNEHENGDFSDILITANAGAILLKGSQVNASNSGSGLAGDIIINATDRVEIADNTDVSSNGYFGRIFIGGFPDDAEVTNFFRPRSVLISGSRLTTNNAVATEAGDIIISAIDTVEIRSSSLAGKGRDGQILIGIDQFDDLTKDSIDELSELPIQLKNVIIDGSQITTDNVESQAPIDVPINSGLIAIVSQQAIDIRRANLVASSGRNGKAGGIVLGSVGRINISSNSRLLSDATPGAVGEGGNIILEGNSVIISDNSVLSARSANAFRGGDVQLETGDLAISGGSQILTTAESTGLAGRILINATGDVTISGAFNLQEQQQVVADTFREVGLEEARLSQQVEQIFDNNNLAPLFSSPEQFNSSREQVINGFIDSGLTTEQAVTAVDFLADRIRAQTALLAQSISPTGTGSGDITINARSLAITNGAVLETSTAGIGNAGNVTINAQDEVNLSDRVSIFSLVKSGSTGNGGTIEITARQLQLADGSTLEAETLGAGNAGTVLIDVSGLVSLNRSLILNTVNREATGNGGLIFVKASEVQLRDGSALDAGTFGVGNAGEVRLQVANSVFLGNESFIFSDVATEAASGNGGNITIEAAAVQLTDRSGLQTSTSGGGRAGNISVNAENIISTRHNSRITSSANSLFGTAGEIQLQAGAIRLEEQAKIEANTASGNGGNINLKITDLLQIGQNSVISTNAGTENAPGNGGNIGINSRFLVGNDNGDITANAYEGSGGVIKIDSLGIFGLENRQQLTPNSDITAFSQENPQLSGDITINSPEINTSGLVDLPKNFLDVTGLVDRDLCRIADRGSSFIITGRGGLPPNPAETLNSNTVAVEWANISPSSGSGNDTKESHLPQNRASRDIIVEAQGWTVDKDGIVILTATAETATPNSGFTHPTCH